MKAKRPDMHRSAFGTFYPALVIAYFVAAIILCVIVDNPVFLAANLLCAASYYLILTGKRGIKTLLVVMGIALLIAIFNPLLNTRGQTVLFYWLGMRPYTLEALAYGACTGCMFSSAMLWFFGYNKVVTTDKLSYLFGGLAPAITLVITMVLRLVPSYQRKAAEIVDARACMGGAADTGASTGYKVKEGLASFSALVTWALEGAITTADSMRSRGYGTGRRTSYARYPLLGRDVFVAIVLAMLFVCNITCILLGAGAIEYFPTISLPAPSISSVLGFATYALFLLMPTIIDIWEACAWRISISGI